MKHALLEDLGRLVLRISLGAMMLLHGVHKVSHGVGGIAGMLAAHGVPRFVAYGTYVGEVIAPLLLIVGAFVRPAAAVMAFNMVVAVAMSHPSSVLQTNASGGWAIELPALYLFGAIAIGLLGAGRFALTRTR